MHYIIEETTLIIKQIMKQNITISLRNFILFTFANLALIFAGFIYLSFAKNEPQYFMPCMMKEVLHLYCPGCGGTHALSDLLHLRILASIKANPLVLYGAVVLLYYWIRFLITLIKNKGTTFIYSMNMNYIWGLVVLMLGFCIVRNILVVHGYYDYLGELIQYWN